MAAYYCPDCEIAYPKLREFDNCPECGACTKYRSMIDPDEQTVELVERRKRHAAFEKWCEENWTPADPVKSAIRFHFEPAKADIALASELIRQMDARGRFLSELHVFLPESRPGHAR